MYFNILRKDLEQALTIVSKSVSLKTPLESLKGVLIEAYEQHATFTCNNQENGILTKCDAEIFEEGSAIVDSKLLLDIVRKLPDDQVRLQTVKDTEIQIHCQSVSFDLKLIQNFDFPRVEKFDELTYRSIDGATFSDMVSKTSFAVSNDVHKAVFMGELIEIEQDCISMIALDGFRVAVKRYDLATGLETKNHIVYGKTLQEIAKLSLEVEEIQLAFSDKQASFIIGDTIFNTVLVEGKFIDYKNIIPNEFETKLRIRRDDLLSALERALLVSRNHLVRFQILSDAIHISAGKEEIGSYEEDIPAELVGKEMEIGFNIRYFLDLLKILEVEQLDLSFNSNISPCILKSDEEPNYIYMVLPVRL